MSLSSPPIDKAVESPRLPRLEGAIALLLALVILSAKLCYVNALPINSDESQHLHVAWGWTQGMVQYRDYFDNHTPLFHLVMAPLVGWLGERADILTWMRLAMLPLLGLSLACIYRLGARLFSVRMGMWAAILTSACPVFLLTATQFRADILWTTAWLVTLAVGLGGSFTRLRAFASGLLLGITFAVSMKTSILLVALLAAGGIILWLSPKPERQPLLEKSLSKALLALAGGCVVPLALIVFFAAQRALPELYYCVLRHNMLLSGGGFHSLFLRWVVFPGMLPLIVLGTRAVLRVGSDRFQAIRRALLFSTAVLFLDILYCFWPLVTRQDFLPIVPLLVLSMTPLLLGAADRLGRAGGLLLVGLTVGQMGLAILEISPFNPKDLRSETLVADVLRLTRPTDFVMDAKGETIFRRRPYYYVLENITQELMARGVIADTIAQEMMKTRTCVTLLKRLPPKSLQWAMRFYLPVTPHLYVAGCYLPSASASNQSEPRSFEVGVGANYVAVSGDGIVTGTMDGVPCAGPVFLNPGRHTFSCSDNHPLAILWAQAAETGFAPLNFHSAAFHP